MALAEIKTIDQLKKNLNLGPGYGGYIELLNALDLPKEEWKNYCSWDKSTYTRNCISACEEYELILMCWEKKQSSAIHSFHFQEGWIRVLEGKLTVETYEVDRKEKTISSNEKIDISAGDSIYLNDNMGFHRVYNATEERTISLHLHIERVDEWEVFDEQSKEFTHIQPKYHQLSSDCENYPKK